MAVSDRVKYDIKALWNSVHRPSPGRRLITGAFGFMASSLRGGVASEGESGG